MKLATLVALSVSLLLAGPSWAADWDKITINDLKGKPLELKKSKVLVVANIASRCGYTPQLEELQKLHDKYKAKGLQVVGFPSNDFRQEPLEGEEIAKFCNLKYNVAFPITKKGHVKGKEIHPLYQYLTSNAAKKGPVSWNFEKFVVRTSDGKVVGRFKSGVKPLDTELTKVVEKELAASGKKSH